MTTRKTGIIFMRHAHDVEAERLATRMLAPRTPLDQTKRAESKAAMLREFRRTLADLPAGSGSRDGLMATTHTTDVRSDLFPGGCRMTDLEPITAERAQEVSERIANALIERIYES